MKKIWLFLGILFSFYLLLPGPDLPPADLPESARSDEPGDTVQIANVSAYFTDQPRDFVLNFYTDYFSRSRFLHIPLPTYRLNHPPEKVRQVFVDTKQSYYLEEAIHPFRESLFINGFEWEKDVFTPAEQRVKNKLLFEGKVWASKVSLRWFYSFWLVRLLVFWFTWLLLFLVFRFWKKEVKAIINDF